MKSIIKGNKKILAGFIVGSLIFSSIGVAATAKLSSSVVSFNNTGTLTDKTDVQDAIDDLYQKAKSFTNCPEGYSCKKIPDAPEETDDEPEDPNKPLYTIVTDANSNNLVDKGDEISLGDEHFYVISNDGTNIDALAKYNLQVGYICTSYDASSCTAISNPTKKQDSTMLGYSSSQSTRRGTVAFTSAANIGTYATEYATTLNSLVPRLNATARIPSKDDMVLLGCSLTGYSCRTAPTWVYSSSYWTSSTYDSSNAWNISSGSQMNYSPLTTIVGFGVRPIITIRA